MMSNRCLVLPANLLSGSCYWFPDNGCTLGRDALLFSIIFACLRRFIVERPPALLLQYGVEWLFLPLTLVLDRQRVICKFLCLAL